ncbi:integumentary mucin C.1-like [Lingula anatina]|uniref:Integumentary mucin C.1-like n=1 Tax=Lingula anatina TaxID=7574 RepID=A0A1S3H8Z5_LINAN|nr:integumentary mucin C.1-like [Lingula anatina]|eukprot:XP_013381594.1 integumentary mucin C.1-like [Lingula anatina]
MTIKPTTSPSPSTTTTKPTTTSAPTTSPMKFTTTTSSKSTTLSPTTTTMKPTSKSIPTTTPAPLKTCEPNPCPKDAKGQPVACQVEHADGKHKCGKPDDGPLIRFHLAAGLSPLLLPRT